MHDLLLAQEIYTIIKRETRKNKFQKVVSIVIELGEIIEHQENITPQNLIYNLKLVDKNKILGKTRFRVLPRKDDKWQLVEMVGN